MYVIETQNQERNLVATIKSDGYNKAKALLTKAGSVTASKSHVKHGDDGTCPADHGKTMLQEARDEFNKLKDEKKMKDGRAAVVAAAKLMGITSW